MVSRSSISVSDRSIPSMSSIDLMTYRVIQVPSLFMPLHPRPFAARLSTVKVSARNLPLLVDLYKKSVAPVLQVRDAHEFHVNTHKISKPSFFTC